MITAAFALRAYRARNDTVTLASTSWTYSLNTSWTQPRDTRFRLRVQVAETAGGSDPVNTWTLQYAVNGGTWTDAGGILTSSTQFTNGDAIGSPGQLGGSGTWISGVGRSVTPTDYVIGHSGNDYAEIEYSLLLPNTLSNNDSVTFRMLNDNNTTTSTVTPTLTVSVITPRTATGAVSISGTPTVSSSGTYIAPATATGAVSFSGTPSISASGTYFLPEQYSATGAISISGTPSVSSSGTHATFSPTSVSNLEFWVDSDDATTITESAGALSQWDEKSGNSLHLTAAGAAQPTYSANEQFGKYGIRFSTDDVMDAPAFTTPLSQPNTIFVVMRLDSIAGATDQAIVNAINATGRHGITFDSGTDSHKLYSGVTYDSGTASTATRLLTGLFNGSSSELWEEGVSTGTGDAGTENYVGVRLGQSETGAIPLSGVIFEVLVYSRALTTQEREDLESYLTQKWLTAPTADNTGTGAVSISGTPAIASSGTFTAAPPKDVLYVRPAAGATAGDLAYISLLEGDGWTVTQLADTASVPGDMSLYDVVFISNTCASANTANKWHSVATGLVVAKHNNWVDGDLYLCGSTSNGSTSTDFVVTGTTHDIAAGYSGTVTALTTAALWRRRSTSEALPAAAIEIVHDVGSTSHNIIFAYESGATLYGGVETAAARRVAAGFDGSGMEDLTTAGSDIFLASIQWASGLTAAPPKDLLYVRAAAGATAGDTAFISLFGDNGWTVTQHADDIAIPGDMSLYDAVYISESCTSTSVGAKWLNVTQGVVMAENGAWSNHELALGSATVASTPTNLTIVGGAHPIAAGYSGSTAIVSSAAQMRYANPVGLTQTNATLIAHVVGIETQSVVWAYESGATMENSFTAPGRRVGMGFHSDTMTVLTTAGEEIVLAALQWASESTPTAPDGNILFVRGDIALNTSETQIISRLEGQGHTVDVTTGTNVTTTQANGYELVLMSKTVISTNVGTKLYNTTAPVLFWEDNQQMLGMMATIDNDGSGSTTWHSLRTTVYVDADASPVELRAGLSGETSFYTAEYEMTWAPEQGGPSQLASGANPIARVGGNGTGEFRYAIYVYEKGANLADNTAAAGKRGFFGLYDDTFQYLNANGLALFDAQVDWLLSPGNPYSVAARDLSAVMIHNQERDTTYWYDETSNNFEGTLVSAPAWTATGGPGTNVPGYFSFDGSADQITIGDVTSTPMALSGPHTMVFWMRANGSAQTAYAHVLGKGDDNFDIRYDNADSDNLTYVLNPDGGPLSYLVATNVLVSNTWQMFMARYDGTNVQIYTIESGSAVQKATAAYSTNPFTLDTERFAYAAQDNAGTWRRWWRGDLAGTSFYATDLSTANFEALYAATGADDIFGDGAVSISGTPTVSSTGTFSSTAPDSIDLYAQVFKSDGTTALTDRILVASNASLTTSYTDYAVTFTVSGTPSKSDWDGARVKVEWSHTLNDTATNVRVTTLNVSGDFSVVDSVIGVGAVSFSGTPTISSSGTLVASDYVGTGNVTFGSYTIGGSGTLSTGRQIINVSTITNISSITI